MIRRKRNQQGAALIIALIMLIMVSLLGAAGYLMSTSESRASAGWSDRQRALFAAEGALKEAENAVKDGVAKQGDVRQAVIDKGTGYFVRHESTLPEMKTATDWTDGNAVTATDPHGGGVFYRVVFEGKAASADGTEEFKATGGVNQAAKKSRFTLYAKAGGIKEGTFVVLSTSKEFD
ncbi:PilX N-terminal domain-containing pilus assembly protein [Uliginosibacterium paludis]|uniref:PilX N-terminal domain-containing pilus assembly protein n=1 Tax=Uliginosibacterium paludis TaxID=1615952 RepID=A0ABV2CRY7_9RHOO